MVVERYEGGVTLRQVMYRLVSEGALPNTAPMYRRLSAQLARLAARAASPAGMTLIPPGGVVQGVPAETRTRVSKILCDEPTTS